LLHDVHYWRREPADVRAAPTAASEPVHLEGAANVVFLAGVVGAVVGSGLWHGPTIEILGVRQQVGNLVRDAILLAMLARSWLATREAGRRARGERVLLGTGPGGGDSLRGHLRHPPAGDGDAPRRRGGRDGLRRPRRARAAALLLGERHPVVLPRQRAHLSRLP